MESQRQMGEARVTALADRCGQPLEVEVVLDGTSACCVRDADWMTKHIRGRFGRPHAEANDYKVDPTK